MAEDKQTPAASKRLRLITAQCAEARALAAGGAKPKQIAERFGVKLDVANPRAPN